MIRRFQADFDRSYQPPSYIGFPASLRAPADDGRPILKIKSHTAEKVRAVGKFLNAFSRIAEHHGPGVYVDLFAGPGILRLAESNHLLWGNALQALQCSSPFARLVFVERDSARCDALYTRARTVARRAEQVAVINGLAEDSIEAALNEIPNQSLVATLVDPFRLEFSLNAVTKLVRARRRLDLILLFAEGMDLTRNLRQAINGDVSHRRRFDSAFGGADWIQAVNLREPPSRNAGRLRALYLQRLREVGFSKTGNEIPIFNSLHRQVYVLLFASRSDLGIKLWNESTEGAQLSLLDLMTPET